MSNWARSCQLQSQNTKKRKIGITWNGENVDVNKFLECHPQNFEISVQGIQQHLYNLIFNNYNYQKYLAAKCIHQLEGKISH